MSNHTPGPWRVEAHYSGPATVAQMRNPDRVVCVNANASAEPPGWMATDANARLIAAAPEMLAMLHRVADALPDLEWTGLACCPFCEMPEPGQPFGPCEFDALIAKAEGRGLR